MNSISAFDAKFEASLARIDRGRLVKQLNELRRALNQSTAAWQFVEPTVARLKLDNAVPRSEESVLLAILRLAAKENRRSLRVFRRFILDILTPPGLLDIIVSSAPTFAPKVRLQSLPPIEAVELRASGLTNVQILHLLRTGIHEYRTTIVRTQKVDFSQRRFDRIDAMLESIDRWKWKEWSSDILEGNSAWELFFDYVKVGAGLVIAGANVAGAVETLGATAVSFASGVGLMASGLHDFEKDGGLP
jgi:hypothetical protein